MLQSNLGKLHSKETDCIDNYCTTRHHASKNTPMGPNPGRREKNNWGLGPSGVYFFKS